jgi:hypothetical protein
MARRMYVQQSRKGGIAVIVIIALILIILGLTNPTMADFRHHLQTQAENKGLGPLSGLATIASGGYYRQNYLVFSLFKEKFTDRTAFVGLGKFIFIKTAK